MKGKPASWLDPELSLIHIFSLVFLGGLYGVREGTIAAAVCVGLTAKQMNIILGKFADRYLN